MVERVGVNLEFFPWAIERARGDRGAGPMTASAAPPSELILYQTEDGRTHIQCRFENAALWLTQALMAELFQKDVRTIDEHLVNIAMGFGASRAPRLRAPSAPSFTFVTTRSAFHDR